MQDKERKAEDDFVKWVKDLPYPAIALKLVLFGLRGWPDRTILCNGMVIFIEFKRPKKPQSSQQKTWQNRLERLGFPYYVCTTKKEAIAAFEKHHVFT